MDKDIYIGSVGGHKLGKKPSFTIQRDILKSWKVVNPLMKSLELRPKLPQLIMIYISLVPWAIKKPIMLVEGQKIIRVTEERMAAEQNVLTRGKVNKTDDIDTVLKYMQEQ